MKRKLTFFTFALTALLLTGCAQGNTLGSEDSSSPELSQPSSSSDTSYSTNQPGSQDAQSNDTTTQMISVEEAKEIALTHANLTADQVTIIKSEIDTDNGKKYYEIEFITQNQEEYDYEIDMYTGEILDYDYEVEYYPSSSETAQSQNGS